MRLLPMGQLAVLVDDVEDPAGWATSFLGLRIAGIVDVVPAARTVLIVADDEAALASARQRASEVLADGASEDSATEIEIEVVYDGPDLPHVADAAGLSADQVVDLHSEATYRVAFCGFAPGFAYLTGLPPELRLPRRSTPRTRVPAGSVAIAFDYAAVYPTESPGGWHLIGSTRAKMFDVDRDPPATLMPGTTVRFVPA
jgi:KipI family sensor histidine kinase inhibitor